MQALFYMDMREGRPAEQLTLFCRSRRPSRKTRDFFLELVNGVLRGRVQIDALVERFSSNWKISRMAGVDRNVLRIAVYELLCCPDIPPKVTINEAIDIAKKYGSDDSGAFINGILDSIRLTLEKEGLEFQIPDGPPLEIGAAAVDADETAPSAAPQPRFHPVGRKPGVVRKRTARAVENGSR
jgi:N utilization substance protein B